MQCASDPEAEAGREDQVIPGRKQTGQGATLPLNMPWENVYFLLLELRVLCPWCVVGMFDLLFYGQTPVDTFAF